MEMEIKNWYLKNFKEDELGQEINGKITFNDLFDTLDRRHDVYELLGDGIDSMIRERIFGELARLMDVDYNYIYEQWLLCD